MKLTRSLAVLSAAVIVHCAIAHVSGADRTIGPSPSVWRAAGVSSELGLETLMSAVMIHELTHTLQFRDLAPTLARLTAMYHLSDDLDDDAVQTRFEGMADFERSVRTEREQLFAAAVAGDRAKARQLVKEARTQIVVRRQRHFVGDDAKYAELEDVFLTLEGVAQWAAYRWLTHPRGGAHLDGPGTLTAFRCGGRRWSQDEGLATFLAVDTLEPDWRDRMFSSSPTTALQLLKRAAR